MSNTRSAANELHDAIKCANLKELERIIKTNRDVSVDTRCGRDDFTLLHWACHHGAVEIVLWLLQHDTNSSLQSKQGWSPLHVASIRGHSTCAQALTTGGCDLAAKDKRGYTPLQLAAAHGRVLTLQSLLRAGADVATMDTRGWTVVHHAAFHGYHGILQLLKKWGGMLFEVDNNGDTPVHLAAREGHLLCLKFLLCSYGNTVEAIHNKNNMGESPKTLAIRFEKKDCIEYMTSAEVDCQFPVFYQGDEYPAHVAAYHGNLQLLSMLIAEGQSHINDTDPLGCLPAHKAASNGHIECLQWLVDHGANFAIVNNAGETPKDLAKRYGHHQCVEILGGDSDADASDEDDEPKPVIEPGALARAKKRLTDLSNQLKKAEANYQLLGGSFEQENLCPNEREQFERKIAELETELEYERIRREELESTVDELRKGLSQQMSTHPSGDLLEEVLKQREHFTKPVHRKDSPSNC